MRTPTSESHRSDGQSSLGSDAGFRMVHLQGPTDAPAPCSLESLTIQKIFFLPLPVCMTRSFHRAARSFHGIYGSWHCWICMESPSPATAKFLPPPCHQHQWSCTLPPTLMDCCGTYSGGRSASCKATSTNGNSKRPVFTDPNHQENIEKMSSLGMVARGSNVRRRCAVHSW